MFRPRGEGVKPGVEVVPAYRKNGKSRSVRCAQDDNWKSWSGAKQRWDCPLVNGMFIALMPDCASD